MTPISSKITAGLIALCAAAFVLAALLVVPVMLSDGDLYWHIASGRWMLENQAVLRIDMFSATYAGYPWLAQGWLSDVALALAYIGAGWGAVLALAASVACLSVGILGFQLGRRLDSAVAGVVLMLALAVAADALPALPMSLGLPLFVLWCAGLANARAENRAPSFKLLAALVLWVNLDTSYLAGLALVAVMALEAVIAAREDRMIVARNWAVFAGFCLVVCVITPYGVEGLSDAIRHVQLPHSGDVRSAVPLLLAIPAVALLVLGRTAPLRLLFLGGLFVLSLYIKSCQLLFAFAVPLLLADTAATVLKQHGHAPSLPVKAAAAFVAMALCALAWRVWLPLERQDGAASPLSAFAKVPKPLLHAAVLNDMAFGGFLIFNDVRPYIDSRPLYGRAFHQRFTRLTHGDRALLGTTLERRRIRWTIFAPGNPAVAAMDAQENWRRLCADQWAVVHVRNTK